jgi:hypothetical protein
VLRNRGCGVALTGGSSLIAGGTKRVCGVGVMADDGFTPGGGKVSGNLEKNEVSGNLGVGIYVSEAPDDGNEADVTEVILQQNTIVGNLTATFDEVEPFAGGLYFAASDADGVPSPATVDQVACSGSAPAPCTRVRAERLLGNTIACNGRNELGFGVPQRSDSNSGLPWDIGSATGSVDMALACSAAAFPNTLSGYARIPGTDLGLAVTTGLIHVDAVGVAWARTVPAAGLDYSMELGTIPSGNGDAAPPGSSSAELPPPAKGFVFCPAKPMMCGLQD